MTEERPIPKKEERDKWIDVGRARRENEILDLIGKRMGEIANQIVEEESMPKYDVLKGRRDELKLLKLEIEGDA